MVGRTPEYVGKKIESREVKLAVLAIAVLPLSILGFTALASVMPQGLEGPLNNGPHGYSEILYAFTSATGNNGSAFAGLTASNPFWSLTLGIAMFVGRFFMIMPALAIAGSLARRRSMPEGAGLLPDHRRALGRPARRPDPDPRRPHLPAGLALGPGRRPARDDPRPAFLRTRTCPDTTQATFDLQLAS